MRAKLKMIVENIKFFVLLYYFYYYLILYFTKYSIIENKKKINI